MVTTRQLFLQATEEDDMDLPLSPIAEILNKSNSSSADDCLDSDGGGGYVVQPRKLNFDDGMDFSDEDEEQTIADRRQDRTPSTTLTGPMGRPEDSSKNCISPPYKKVRALRLFDSPTTPKTLMKKSTMHTPLPNRDPPRIFRCDKPRAMPVVHHHLQPHSKKNDVKPQANINPFTPDRMQRSAKKRARSKHSVFGLYEGRKFDVAESDESDSEFEQPTKRVALQDVNVTRYHQEFEQKEEIGRGEFGSVFRCTHRLAGVDYALKKSKTPVAGNAREKHALNEVYAHAVLGTHQHVVRYHSAWAEDDYMIIQNEYCNGGSLANVIAKNYKSKKHLSEEELKQLLLHVAKGLKYIHSMNLVHMDIKPGNIFISREEGLMRSNEESADDGYDEDGDEEERTKDKITYKIGDLGHVTSINNPQVEEGDCRYLPKELLDDKFDQLTKVDIFALGLTVYEAAGGGPLPGNGDEWHQIRGGNLKYLPGCSKEFNDLLKQMIHLEPGKRPSAVELIKHQLFSSNSGKTVAELERELQVERSKSAHLSKQLAEIQANTPKVTPSNGLTSTASLETTEIPRLRPTPTRSSSRVIGRKTNRSISTTNF